jgi:hypothetical protein
LNGIFGSNRSLLNQDSDHYLPPPILERIETGSGLSQERIMAMTLASYVGHLNNAHLPRSRKTWLLPTTIASNDRRRPGLQYCPVCLRHDQRPYMRRLWRVGFATMCTRHAVILRDRCPHCAGYLHLHRAPSLRHCFRCGGNLTSQIDEKQACNEMLAQQIRFEKALHDGWIEICGRPVYSTLWFMIVRRVCALAVNGKRAERFLEATAECLGGDASPIEKDAPQDTIETL